MSRLAVKTKLTSLISQGLSAHLISLPSLGTSRFLRELSLPNRQILYLDGALPNFSLPQPQLLQGSPTTIILDHFGYLLDTQTTGFFRQLKAIRDSHRETLNFILATNRHHQLHIPLTSAFILF